MKTDRTDFIAQFTHPVLNHLANEFMIAEQADSIAERLGARHILDAHLRVARFMDDVTDLANAINDDDLSDKLETALDGLGEFFQRLRQVAPVRVLEMIENGARL